MVQKFAGNMAYGSQTLHRAYSVSSVEGVELRLSDKFKPTNKVTLPLQYTHGQPQSLNSTSQYDFKTEDNFLQWLEGVRRAESEREEQRKQQQMGAEAAEAALQRQDDETVPEGSTQANNEFPMQNNVSQRPLLPVAASLGNEILQPVPLASGVPKPATNNNNVRMDNWDDFEGRSSDPFEMTELETINDMEELRNVLANSAPVAAPMAVPAMSTNHLQQSSPPPMEDSQFEDPASQSSSTDVTMTDDTCSNQVHIETSQNQVSFQPNRPDHVDEGNRLQNIPPAHQPMEKSGPTLPNRTLASTSLPSGLPPLGSDPFASRSPLPPIGPSRENSDTSLLSHDSAGVASVSSDQGRRSPPPQYAAVDPSQSSRNSVHFDPPPNYPMDELEANFSPANLSRYSPLPPPPHQTSTISIQPPDPTYEAMSVEEKNFVNNIVGMGFPKGRTARAVKNIGNDDRQVVDLLCAVDSLCGQGYPEQKVEVALSLQDNNQEKAQTFLSLWQRFEELGFKSEDIKRELVLHGNDEEKVLDTLTR